MSIKFLNATVNFNLNIECFLEKFVEIKSVLLLWLLQNSPNVDFALEVLSHSVTEIKYQTENKTCLV